jgi:hypothetical protein
MDHAKFLQSDVTESTTTMTTATPVNNPYAQQRRSSPGIFNKPLHQDASNLTTLMETAQHALLEKKAIVSEKEFTAESSLSSSDIANCAMSAPNLHNWQRSPSLNLESAEILTIPEVVQHAALYLNRSVRLTGVLAQKHAQSETSQLISFQLGDPLAPLKYTSFASLPTTALSKGISGLSGRTAKTPTILRKPLVSKRKATTALTTTTTTPTSSCCKKAVVNNPQLADFVWIWVNPFQVNVYASLGDLVMVIGRVVAQTSEHCQQPDAEQQQVQQYAVEARIVTTVNGTNMKLYNDALLRRRNHLIQQRKKDDGSEPSLWQGCGPPPYV